ncbi:MAG: hypothetical protein DRI94_13945 [Bacteroidetes bacterium]|nr:MAG: hypothetical protein DRI94_13945 [Bacteroidota bacterium]
MKKYFFIILFILVSEFLFSQTVDTTVIKIKNRKIIVLNEKISDIDDTMSINFVDNINDVDAHWAGLGFGVNYFVNSALSSDLSKVNLQTGSGGQKYLEILPEKSFEIQLNFAEKNFSIYQDYISLTTGMGFQINNYRFRNNYRLDGSLPSISANLDTVNNFSKSKLIVSYFSIPLLLEFQFPNKTNPDNRIFLSMGAVAQLRIGSHAKYVYDLNGSKTKDKNRDRFHLNPFLINYVAMIGYHDFSIYAKYSNSTVFVSNEGPKIYPISFGIILNI